MLIYRDAQLRPDLFFWNGQIPADRLENWLREHALEIPDDLFGFWLRTGGGDIFESETILGPFADAGMGDDVDSANHAYHQSGVSSDYLIFHTGIGISAVRFSDKRYVALSDTEYRELKIFPSFEEWYKGWIRNEYAGRYGLPVCY